MFDLRDRLRSLDDEDAPELWAEALARAQQLETGPSVRAEVRPLPDRKAARLATMRRLIAAVVAAILAVTAILIVHEAFRVGRTKPAHTPAPSALVSGPWGPHGILFVGSRGGASNVWLAPPDGSAPIQLTNNSNRQIVETGPVWSPDGSEIAFAQDSQQVFMRNPSPDEQPFSLYVMDANGSNPIKLADGRQPAWSPDGSKIAFTVGEATLDQPTFLFVMNADGSGQTKLARLAQGFGSGPAVGLSWSPDSTELAFATGTDTGAEISAVALDGSAPRVLAQGTPWAFDPVWSPDGGKIAFEAGEPGSTPRLYTMNPDGSGLVEFGKGDQPAWSPDGARIAFDAKPGGEESDVFVMRADGSSAVNLTNQPGDDVSPFWSPDGDQITFLSTRGEQPTSKLYVMNANGSDQRPLDVGNDRFS